MSATTKKRVCIGAFAGAHGVKGEIKVKTFTESPQNISAYGPVETEDSDRTLTLTFVRELKAGLALVRAADVKTREDAEALKGIRFYVGRDKLPEPAEDEFYLDDLVGLKAIDETGAVLGVVGAVYNFGAGDMIELKDIPDVKGVRLVPFTKENVRAVNAAGGKIQIARAAIEDAALAEEKT